jgi:Cu2+-exporting ATPase
MRPEHGSARGHRPGDDGDERRHDHDRGAGHGSEQEQGADRDRGTVLQGSGHGADHAHSAEHDHGAGHHAHMVADFRRRFWVSLVLTVPILLLAPLIQGWLGLTEVLAFPGDHWVQWILATTVYLYGGWPFLTGLLSELGDRRPGMMTLIGLAITVAYVYSSAVAFGLEGKTFFWELATLIDVMLLGHWIEMRSVMGASRAL